MIIDFHAHIRMDTLVTPKYWRGWIATSQAASGASEERIGERIRTIMYIGADELVRDMDEAGIDKTVVVGVDLGLCKELDDYKLNWYEYHEPIREALKKYPDRLIGFVGIDPRREKAVELLEMAVREWGMKGVKLHPSAGFYPNDPICYPVYEKASELGIPIHIHTGGEPYPFKVKWCMPVYVDDVAADFPDVTIILAHAGLWWWYDALTLAGYKGNVMLDITAWQQWAHTNPVEFFRAVRTAMDLSSFRKVLLGSDWPAVSMLMSQKKWVDMFRNLPGEVKEAGIEFKQREIDAILGGNAARILGLAD